MSRRTMRERAAEELGRRHVVPYTCLTYPPYRPNWHHWVVGDVLNEVIMGGHKRVIFNEPPRHGKSEEITVRFPPHAMGRVHGLNVIVGSYAAGLATGFGRKARNQIKSPVFKRIFPGVTLAKDIGTAGAQWALNTGSEFNAAGVGGGITGKGADILIIDDPIKDRKQANSVVYREALKDWYRDVALTRLSPDGAVIIPMTRWHHDDLVGWLLREWPEENWVVVRLPALMDNDPTKFDKRKPGEALWEQKFTAKMLRDVREEIGPNSFNCLFQQKPTKGAAAILKIEWLQQDFSLDMLPRFARIVASWDTAFEKGERNAYNVGTVWGDTGGDYYLLEVVRFRGVFPEVKKRMVALHDKHHTDAVLVEKAASGRDLLHELRKESSLPLIGVPVHRDKVQRADAVSGRFEARRVHVPRNAPWLADYFTELDEFPETAYLDQVDSTTQAIAWMSRYGAQEAFAA